MKIADLLFGLGIEKDADFQAAVVKAGAKAGDAGGKTLGQRLSAGFKNAAKGLIPGLGIGAGIAAFGGLQQAVSGAVGFLKDAAAAAIEDESSVSQLTAALKANVPGWDGSTAAIDRRIRASEALGFSDDQIRASMAALVAATNDQAKALDIQSVAMDLARFKRIDLLTASEALVKVEAGQFRILKSLGIELREGATQTEALAAVQKVAGGQAQAYGETTAGAAEAAGIAFDELKEDIGKILLPVLKDLAVFARKELIPALREVGDAIGWVIDRVTDVKNIPGSVADWWRGLFGIDPETNRMVEEARGVAIRNFFGGAARETETESARWAGNTRSFVSDAAAALSAGADEVETAAKTMAKPISVAMSDARRKAIEEARGTPGDVADALIAGQQDVESGMDTLKDLMTDKWTDASRIAFFKGVLNSKELARGLASGEADVRSQAEKVKADALAQLQLLESGAADISAQTGVNLEEGLNQALTPVRDAALALARGAATALKSVEDEADAAGADFGKAFVSGIIVALQARTPALSLSAGKVLAGLSDTRIAPPPTVHGAPPTPRGVPSFQTGAMSVPATGVYGLHAREMVVPPNAADALRGFFGGLGGSAAPSVVTTNYNLTVNGVQQAFRTRDDFIKALDAVARFGGMDGRLAASG